MTLGDKGASWDLFFIVIVILAIAISTLLALYLNDAIRTPLLGMIGGSVDATNILNDVRSGLGVMDYMIAFVFFMMGAISIIFAALVRNHPIFLIVSLIMTAILLLVSPIISNIMLKIWQQPQFSPYSESGGGSVELPMTARIFQYLPLIMGAVSVLTMIVAFSKGGENI